MTLRKCYLSILILLMAYTLTWAQDAKQVPDKVIDKIVGAWKIQKILSGNKEIAKNPTSGQWIEFKSDGTYVNHATSLDSGAYRINENQSIVYLESSVNADPAKNPTNQVTEWSLSFANENLIMQRRSTGKGEHADKMKYFYVRVGQEQRALNK